jgi:hypothetical protein
VRALISGLNSPQRAFAIRTSANSPPQKADHEQNHEGSDKKNTKNGIEMALPSDGLSCKCDDDNGGKQNHACPLRSFAVRHLFESAHDGSGA